MTFNWFKKLFYLFTLLLIVSCSNIPSKQQQVSLQQAQEALAAAQAYPNMTDKAAVALYEAEKTLEQAKNATNLEEMQHLAYIARRKAEIAVAEAEGKATKAQRAELTELKEKLLLSSQERKNAKEAEYAKAQASALAAKNKMLKKQLESLKNKENLQDFVFTFAGDVLFTSGQSELRQQALAQIRQISDFLIKNPRYQVLVEGYTDDRGSTDYNLGLSQRRADEVKFALMREGVASNRIVSRGLGESQPIADNTSSVGRQQNRRVEITILSPEKSAF